LDGKEEKSLDISLRWKEEGKRKEEREEREKLYFVMRNKEQGKERMRE
jgi:hypothetical protein